MTTHRMYKSPENQAWRGMKVRCKYDSPRVSRNYRDRNITVCDEWLHNFMAFYNHIGPRPSDKHSLDRIDNSRGYEPGNVRWATIHEQNANKRTNNKMVGVCKISRNNRWHAQLIVNKVIVLDKEYDRFDDAVRARKKAESTYLVTLIGKDK